MTPDQITAAAGVIGIYIAVIVLIALAGLVARVDWVKRALDLWLGGGE